MRRLHGDLLDLRRAARRPRPAVEPSASLERGGLLLERLDARSRPGDEVGGRLVGLVACGLDLARRLLRGIVVGLRRRRRPPRRRPGGDAATGQARPPTTASERAPRAAAITGRQATGALQFDDIQPSDSLSTATLVTRLSRRVGETLTLHLDRIVMRRGDDDDPRRRLVHRRGRASGGSCSAPTAAARRRCCASPRSTSTRRRARSTCSVSGSAAPTCACCAGASATRRRRSPTSCARRCAALDAVRTARYAALEPWWHRYTAADDDRARDVPRPDGRRRASPSASSARCRRASANACCSPAR